MNILADCYHLDNNGYLKLSLLKMDGTYWLLQRLTLYYKWLKVWAILKDNQFQCRFHIQFY